MPSRRLLWPVGLLSFLLLASTAWAEDFSYVRIVRLSLVEGDVQLQRPDVEGWLPIAVNTPLQQGYRLYAGNGRAEIEFESGAVARLAPDTLVELTELILLASGGRSTQVYLQQGTATFYANLAREDSFLVLTPNLQVTVPEQARFRVNVGPQATTVNVYKGEVGVSSAGGTTRVSKGQMLQWLADNPTRTYLARLPERDDWDRWNDERDDVVSSARSSDYIPPHVRYGATDLDRYGSWIHVSSYGYGWQPYTSFGWTPFSLGKWVWCPGLGWNWVSYEPWGWLPYHYGRWVFEPGYGWIWLPGGFDHYGPGLVGWVEGPGWIGWYPLGPGNRGRGTVVTTSTEFVSGHAPPPGFKRPDPEREGRPVEQPSITPGRRARMPIVPEEGEDVERPRPGLRPREGTGEVDRPTGTGNVVTVAPNPQPLVPKEKPLPAEAGEIIFDPTEGRYVNRPSRRVPEAPAHTIAPPRAGSQGQTPMATPPPPAWSKPPKPERLSGGEQPDLPRAERISPPPRMGPSRPRGAPSGGFESSFEGTRPRGGITPLPARERIAPPSPRIEARPPSISPPPRMEAPKPMSVRPPARSGGEGARATSKKGE